MRRERLTRFIHFGMFDVCCLCFTLFLLLISLIGPNSSADSIREINPIDSISNAMSSASDTDTISYVQIDTLVRPQAFVLYPGILVGDVDASGDVDIDDAVYIIAYALQCGPEPLPISYVSVRQAYVRILYLDVLVDADSLRRVVSIRELGSTYYLAQADSAQ